MTEAQITVELVAEAMNRETVPYGSDDNYERIVSLRELILQEREHGKWEAAGRPVVKYSAE